VKQLVLLSHMSSKSLPPCPYCGFAAISHYALMMHIEIGHSTFEWLDNGLAEPEAEEPVNSVGDFSKCPKEDCQDTILLAELEAHLDLHDAGTITSGETKEFADAYCSNIAAESNQPLKTHFGGNFSDKLSNFDELQDSSPRSRRKDQGFLNDPSSREQSFKPIQAVGSVYQRLGVSLLTIFLRRKLILCRKQSWGRTHLKTKCQRG
jgi:hypothetical protein